MILGRRIRNLRKAAGMTQMELARRTATNQGYLARLENGERTNPSLAILRRLAKALGTTPANLLSKERHAHEQ
jgi:transcriptional regulator with XRE-family HTH domain